MIVVCKWNDAFSSDVQMSLADIPHAPLVVETLGYLLRDDEEGISVASEKVDTQFRGYTFIPRVLVISCNPVVKPRKPRVKKSADSSRGEECLGASPQSSSV